MYSNDVPNIRETCILILKMLRDTDSETTTLKITNDWKQLLNVDQNLDHSITSSLIR